MREYMFIAVYIDSYVITLGLWAKYDIDGHYFRFVARILANPQKKFQKQIVPVFIRITINISFVFISELVGKVYCLLLGKDSQGFARICETLGEDSLGFYLNLYGLNCELKLLKYHSKYAPKMC